ncbi:hypothetical protein KKC17_01095 [Patescibacteria group bacterium]|nr:hypothetical protein [Patescibacteria group bacterium]
MNEFTPNAPAPKRNTTLIMVVVVVVAIILLALGYYLTSNQTGTENTPANSEQTGEQAGDSLPMPEEVFSYVGEVTTVGENELTVLAKPVVNYLTADTSLTVTTNEETQIVKRTIPKVLPEDGNVANLFKQETVTLDDVKTGDQVTVVSATNIKGQTTFTASRVEVLNIQ